MKRITEQSTLSELAIELGKLGIEYLNVAIEPGHQRAYIVKLGRHVGRCSIDSGLTLANAIDGALARYMHRVAAEELPIITDERSPLIDKEQSDG